jgi:hypothetical protein
MISPIKKIYHELIEEEILVHIEFDESWKFDRLKIDEDDFIVYVANDSYEIRRFWLKTVLPDLKNKKIIFNDIDYHRGFIEIYFREAK